MGYPFHRGDVTAAGGPQSDGAANLLDASSLTTTDPLRNRHADSATPDQSVFARTGPDNGTADRNATVAQSDGTGSRPGRK